MIHIPLGPNNGSVVEPITPEPTIEPITPEPTIEPKKQAFNDAIALFITLIVYIVFVAYIQQRINQQLNIARGHNPENPVIENQPHIVAPEHVNPPLENQQAHVGPIPLREAPIPLREAPLIANAPQNRQVRRNRRQPARLQINHGQARY
ncbi:Oidioi.mRNA.OKI2018_I69.PAR.g13074.t1.cds [Oikopleura dioica]|uniref:Oidioi.mRNA.OKI2018_I69.PAR.g13074.t1.cds n=1 Tax=Oikopleura dioica TaxID=34765 RepID=A0ABN7S7S6_OIKDI|nr:Oidioi.mRNA.OKI2018_I69.PAR.g13074.t1.cds [Oikopleura dioica]